MSKYRRLSKGRVLINDSHTPTSTRQINLNVCDSIPYNDELSINTPLIDLRYDFCYGDQFLLQSMFGSQQFSLKDTRSKVVVLDFSTSWCGPCYNSIPDKEEVFNRFRTHPDFMWVTVLMDVNQPYSCTQWGDVGESGIMPIIDGGTPGSNPYWNLQNNNSFPTTMVIDKDGKKLFESTQLGTEHIDLIQDALDDNSYCQQITDDLGSVTEFLHPRLKAKLPDGSTIEDALIRVGFPGDVGADAFCRTQGFTHSTYSETYPPGSPTGWRMFINSSLSFNDVCNCCSIQGYEICGDSNLCGWNIMADYSSGQTHYRKINCTGKIICRDELSTVPIYGCTDSDALNYNPQAKTDDGSCEYHGADGGIVWGPHHNYCRMCSNPGGLLGEQLPAFGYSSTPEECCVAALGGLLENWTVEGGTLSHECSITSAWMGYSCIYNQPTTIQDIIFLTDLLLSNPMSENMPSTSPTYDYSEFDLNGDGFIDVLDVVTVINNILGNPQTTSSEQQELQTQLDRLNVSKTPQDRQLQTPIQQRPMSSFARVQKIQKRGKNNE